MAATEWQVRQLEQWTKGRWGPIAADSEAIQAVCAELRELRAQAKAYQGVQHGPGTDDNDQRNVFTD
jgi:hypothetical protein